MPTKREKLAILALGGVALAAAGSTDGSDGGGGSGTEQWEVRSTSVSRSTITAGDGVTVTASYMNVGDASGTIQKTLYVNNEPTKQFDSPSRSATASPGQLATLEWSGLRFNSPGEYNLRVGKAPVGKVTVEPKAPADFHLVDSSISSKSIGTGDSATITTTWENTGGQRGTVTKQIKLNGTGYGEKSVTLDPSQRGTMEWAFTFNDPGDYTVVVGSQTIGTITVSDAGTEQTLSYSQGNRRGGQALEITFYQSKQNYNSNGLAPAKAAAKWVHKSLRDRGLNHTIYFGYDPVDPPSEYTLCTKNSGIATSGMPAGCGECNSGTVTQPLHGDLPIDWWQHQVRDGTIPRVAKDSNMLILDKNNGGGCAGVGGNAGVVGMGDVSSVPDHFRSGSGDFSYHIHAAMHEIAHNLGSSHSNAFCETWTENGEFHTTPSYGRVGHTGVCGQQVPAWKDVRDLKRVYHLHFSDCLIENCKIL